MRGLINTQDSDDECFRWCLLRHLNSVNKNPDKIRTEDKKLAKQLNFKDAIFPVHKTDCARIKKKMFSLMCLVMKRKHHAVFVI